MKQILWGVSIILLGIVVWTAIAMIQIVSARNMVWPEVFLISLVTSSLIGVVANLKWILTARALSAPWALLLERRPTDIARRSAWIWGWIAIACFVIGAFSILGVFLTA